MDILNFISWIKGKRLVTTVDPAKTLIPVALKDGRRDDDYLTGAISVEDLAAQIAPQLTYKVYTALLSQTGTSAPVATVLENTFTGSISFVYDGDGEYLILSSDNEFVRNKTLTHLELWGNDEKGKGRIGNVKWRTTNSMTLRNSNAIDPASLVNNIGGNDILTSIEIRVYN